MYGNCLLYALLRRLSGGRIALTWTSIRVPVPRFWHVSDGVWSRFAPVKRQRGYWAMVHKLWFRGRIITEVKK